MLKTVLTCLFGLCLISTAMADTQCPSPTLIQYNSTTQKWSFSGDHGKWELSKDLPPPSGTPSAHPFFLGAVWNEYHNKQVICYYVDKWTEGSFQPMVLTSTHAITQKPVTASWLTNSDYMQCGFPDTMEPFPINACPFNY
tara:strand:- start:71732 stop:72154 length:423 start_codon:yes stop_codon:yes gene_type:complete